MTVTSRANRSEHVFTELLATEAWVTHVSFMSNRKDKPEVKPLTLMHVINNMKKK